MKFIQLCSLGILTSLMLAICGGCAAQGPNLSGEPARIQQEEETFAEILLKPSELKEKAPEQFKVKFVTNEGDFVIECYRKWAPNGADRFYNMVKNGYFKNIYIFRAIKGFMFQFGIHGNPKVSAAWREANIKDDDPANAVSNKPFTISFAQTNFPNSRSCQMFINLGDNAGLDVSRNGSTPFMPFGKVVTGKEVIGKIYTDYGENDASVQGTFMRAGNTYIKKKFPNLSYIKSAELVKAKTDAGSEKKQGNDKE